MLPPGTFAALKGHPNETVVIAIFARAVGQHCHGLRRLAYRKWWPRYRSRRFTFDVPPPSGTSK